jgi:hypothetical protein
MNTEWQRTFRHRMRHFENHHTPPPGSLAVSIKVRVTSGCYHREHSPHAYELIDKHLGTLKRYDEFAFEEHESGPELLVYVAAVTAGISLAKSVIDLIIAILKARSEGIKKGDHPTAPLELIVRSVYKEGEYKEETVLQIGHHDTVDRKMIEKHVKKAVADLLKRENKKPAIKTLKRDAAKHRRTP